MNENFERKLCFVPKSYQFDDVYWNDDRYLTIALREGMVLSEYEFENKWLHDQSQFDEHYLKVMDVNDTTWEMCPHCEHEVELAMKWEVQRCPVCGKFICPCSMCSPYYECAGCPLDEMCEKINGLNEQTCE